MYNFGGHNELAHVPYKFRIQPMLTCLLYEDMNMFSKCHIHREQINLCTKRKINTTIDELNRHIKVA